MRGPNSNGRYEARLEGQAGVAVYSSAGVTLDRVNVRATYGDGVYLAGDSSRITVRDGIFERLGRQGIAPVFASDVVVEANRFDRVARSVFDLEPAVPRWSVRDVHLRANTVGTYGNFVLAAGGAGENVSGIWLEANEVTGGNGIAVYAGMPRWLRHDLHVVDNRSRVAGRVVGATGRAGVMQIARIDGVEIRGNEQPIADDGVAISLTDVCHADVRDNDFPGASEAVRRTGDTENCSPELRGGPPSSRPKGTTTPDRAGRRAETPRSPPVEDAVGRDWLIALILGGLAAFAVFLA
ncbi:MAG TPA: right-handed parallel beta-helix repeat-containing protein, partial [Acidimicrobiia bacterium]|nr:right-handed parallel beta-helix repeat-containing protein [Acidimicrobiia bacterium]